MGWIYEAEQVLLKLKQDDLKTKNIGFFAAVNADLLLKKRQYKEALPYLELSLKNEKEKVQKQRFTYLLAQLYHKNGNTTEAFNSFTAVTKLNPPYEMDFNARIYRAELSDNIPSVRKELKKMIANPNNKEYKDQLYYVLGKTYLNEGDTVRAIENFIISADTSTRNGYDKAVTLITLGDLYYKKQNYIKAQPCYDEASKIITAEKEDFARVTKRAETLSELVVQHEIVTLQDSLQQLAALPLDKQKEIVQKIIDKLIADEKAAEEAEKKLANQNRPQNFDDNFDMMPPIGMAPQTGDWYFYNPTIVKSGVTEFRKKWGTRKLEDNWRRTNKTASLFNDETASANTSATGLPTDSLKKDSAIVDDSKSLDFYLRQIPVSKAQFDKSNEELANALYNMGFIYKDKVEDLPMAIKTFDEFERRFPTDERRVETYYYSYLLQTRLENAAAAESYKAKLIANFPNSKYVEVISQPDYFERLNRMYEVQDSLYFATYKAYNASDFKTVKSNSEYIQKTYPLSTLLPKFLFLNALSVGKTEKPEVFETTLSELVEKYPKSDVSSMSKDILALIKQGNEAKAGTSSGSLLARRDEAIKQEIENVEERKFVADKTGKHRLMLLFNSDTERLNKLLFNVAAFNFTRFMVKDFDLINTKLDSTQTILSVTNFESFEEAEWYLNSVKGDSLLNQLLSAHDIQKLIISETNFGTMFSFLGLEAYMAFLNSGFKEVVAPKQLAVVDKKPVTKETKSKVEKPVAVVPATPQKEVAKQPEVKPEPVVEKKAEPLAEKKVEPKPVQQPASKPIEPTVQQAVAPKVEPVQDNVPLFKNLFAYRANEPHFMAISVLSGTFDFEKLKTAFDAFNAKNYGMLNLKVTKDVVDKQQIIIVGSFPEASVAKSYLFRVVQETALYEQIKGTNYRNLIGSQRNLNVMMQQNAMTIYFEFMQEYYLK
jgi:tetratricopeptide (TPR) repeat protein